MGSSAAVTDLIVGAIVTFLGVGAAVWIDRWREHRAVRARDLRLVQNLFDRLASKRAFSHEESVGSRDDPEDRARCIQSVLDVRARASDLCDALARTEDAVPLLRRMEIDCVAYLNFVEREPAQYATGLIRLRDRLFEAERHLARKLPGLVPVRPGERVGTTPEWLSVI